MPDMFDDGMQARGEIRRLLQEHDHLPRKAYGQNFLVDPNVVDRMVRAAGITSDTQVLEIGAGTGAVTIALAAVAGRVVAYEVDHALEPVLDEVLTVTTNVEVRFGDASRIDFSLALDGGPWTMVSNLPYNVGTGIVLDILQGAPDIDRLVVMVQREVADRFLAEPGAKTYGIPSVIVGLHATAHLAFGVSPQVFEPAPRVDSAVVVIDRKPAPVRAERAIEIASAAFGQRRKMLRRSLAGTIADESVLVTAGIDPTTRPEALLPQDFVSIADAEAAL